MRIVDYTRYEMNNKALEAFRELGEDEELGQADWTSVVKYITCLATEEGNQMHPHAISINENEQQRMHMQDTRLRLLNGKTTIPSVCIGNIILMFLIHFNIKEEEILMFTIWKKRNTRREAKYIMYTLK